MNTTVVDSLLAGIETGAIPFGVFSDDAVLDATVPNWRFSVHGGEPVREQLNGGTPTRATSRTCAAPCCRRSLARVTGGQLAAAQHATA